MAFICIPKNKIDAFKSALKNKELDIATLVKLSTEERTALFEKFAGENAKAMNTLFEEKLILKNRLQGLKNWASKTGEIGRYDPAKKAKIEALLSEFRAKQQERIFSPKENEAFLADLAEETLGTRITKEEAKNVFDLTIKADGLRRNFDEMTGKWKSEQNRLDYGASKVVLEKYTQSLKDGDLSVKDLIKKTLQETKQMWSENAPKAIASLLLKTLKTISDNSISLVATMDNSFIGRQGLKTLMTHPTVWWDGAKNSFTDIYKTLGGKNARDALMADIYSKPNFINDRYELAKLIPRTEEQFPTSLPERIPVIGRLFTASEHAFTGSAVRMRTGLFDLLSDMAERNGVDMSDKYQIQSLGKMINSLTARGQWGQRGEPAVVRLVFWAPRMIKGNIDILTAHVGQDLSSFARKQAAINLVKIAGETALIMTIANAIKPGSAETDPRSSNFGKIKVGNTTFDITGGMASLVVLASRVITNSTKSTTTGIVRELGSGYAETSRMDVLINFLESKTTPPVSAIVSWLKGADITGKTPTIGKIISSAFTPISIQNAIQLKDDASVQAVLGVILDGLGINANTYQPTTDWGQNAGAELQQFRQKVGDAKFKAANDKFNRQFSAWITGVVKDPKFQDLSEDDKQKVVTSKKSAIKDQILKQYGFKYKTSPKKTLPKFQ